MSDHGPVNREELQRASGELSQTAASLRGFWLLMIACAVGWMLVGLLLGIALIGRPAFAQEASSTQRKTAAQAGPIFALARLEPASGLIRVGATPGARIVSLEVAVDDTVEKEALLAILDGHAQARAQLDLAQASKAQALDERQRRRDQLALEREREDRLQDKKIKMLDDTFRTVRLQDDRLSRAITSQPATLPPGTLNELESGRDQARIEGFRAYLELEQAKLDQELLARRRALEDRALADGQPADQVLDAQIAAAQAAFDQTEIRAPIAGQVIRLDARAGEVCAGSILLLADTADMVAIAEVDQSDLPRVRVGDVATLSIEGRTVSGSVVEVGRLVGMNLSRPIDPLAPQDLRVAVVRIQLAAAEPAARYLNMQVETRIEPRAAGRR